MRRWRLRWRRTQGAMGSLMHQTVDAGRSVAAEAERLRHRPPRWLIWAGVGLAALLGPGLVELGRLTLRERAMERDLAALRAKQTSLLAERTRLESDATYVEGLIRGTFKQARPGELVIPLKVKDAQGTDR